MSFWQSLKLWLGSETRRRPAPRRKKPYRLELESLEDRCLLAGFVTVMADGDTLRIEGDGNENGIEIVGRSDGGIDVRGIPYPSGGAATRVRDGTGWSSVQNIEIVFPQQGSFV